MRILLFYIPYWWAYCLPRLQTFHRAGVRRWRHMLLRGLIAFCLSWPCTGWAKKPDCFSDLITLWRLVLERRAVCHNFRNSIEKKVQNWHFNEFKYSLPNLLKSLHQLKLCYIWPEHMDFAQYTNIQWNNCHFPTELVQTKLRVGTLCLDDHHQSFWQLIDRSIQCVLT